MRGPVNGRADHSQGDIDGRLKVLAARAGRGVDRVTGTFQDDLGDLRW